MEWVIASNAKAVKKSEQIDEFVYPGIMLSKNRKMHGKIWRCINADRKSSSIWYVVRNEYVTKEVKMPVYGSVILFTLLYES